MRSRTSRSAWNLVLQGLLRADSHESLSSPSSPTVLGSPYTVVKFTGVEHAFKKTGE